MQDNIKGLLFIIIAVLAGALQAVLIRFISVNPLTLIAYFQVIFMIGIFILNHFLSKDPYKLKHPMKLIFPSTIFIFSLMLFYYIAIRNTTLATATLTRNTAPIFAFIFAVIFLKEKFEWHSLTAIVVATFGLFLIFYDPLVAFDLGALAGIVAGASLGAAVNFNRALAKRGHIINFMFFQTIFITIYSFPFLFTEIPTLKDLGLIAIFTIFLSFIPTILFLNGLRWIKAQHAGILLYIEVFLIILFGFLIFKEIPNIRTWLGGIFIIAAGMWIIFVEAKLTKSI